MHSQNVTAFNSGLTMKMLGNSLVVASLKIGLTAEVLPRLSQWVANVDVDTSDRVRNHGIQTKVTMLIMAGMMLVMAFDTCQHL